MAQWPFIIAAYACTITGTLVLAGWSYMRMRASEARVAALREDKGS
jgi:uncharacterized integral membrane protein